MSAIALRVLRALEWSGRHGACPSCRACRRCAEALGYTFAGHRDGCELAAAIRELEAPRRFNMDDTIRVTLHEVGVRLVQAHGAGSRIDGKNRITGKALDLLPILAPLFRHGTAPFALDIEIAPFAADVPDEVKP